MVLQAGDHRSRGDGGDGGEPGDPPVPPLLPGCERTGH
jgi:hypothetical protein